LVSKNSCSSSLRRWPSAVLIRPSTGDDTGVAFPHRRPTFESAGRRLGYGRNRNSDTVSVLDLDAMTLLRKRAHRA
jgi:hypothetical protein